MNAGPWIKIGIAVAVLAVVGVIVVSQRQQADEAGWAELAAARQEGSVEALEDARETARGTSAEPWINFHLTMALYEAGGSSDLQRAIQVAEESISDHPDHVATGFLRNQLPALESYRP